MATRGTARNGDSLLVVDTTPTNEVVASSVQHGSMCAVLPVLGWGYWQSFMKRNGHVMKSTRAVKFKAKRAEWRTYKNVKCMYDGIYNKETITRKGIAMNLRMLFISLYRQHSF